MILHVLLTCSCTILVAQGQRFSKAIQSVPRMGYSSSILHIYPETKELHDESPVKVNYQRQQDTAPQSIQSRGGNQFLYSKSNNDKLYTGTTFNNPKNVNSFSVGYNISFSDSGILKKKENLYTRANNKKIENAEVITGRSKKNEKVRAPDITSDLSPKDFVAHAFLKQKQLKYTTSPLKTRESNRPKFLNLIREHSSKLPSQSPKFTYNTQQNVFKDTVIKTKKPDPIQLGQDFQTSYQTSGRWKNVGHGLEISKSIEPLISEENLSNLHQSRYTNGKSSKSDQSFNHDSALKTSESFDFSNAHGQILYEDNNSANDNFPQSSDHQPQTASYQVNEHFKNDNNVDGVTNKQPYFDLNSINIEAHIPSQLRNLRRLPLDTSLLKDVVLTTNSKEEINDPNVIPVRFDLSSIKTAMQGSLDHIQNYASQPNVYPNQYAQKTGPYPNPSYAAALTYEDHVPSGSQNTFRIYGKPEPVETRQYGSGFSYDKKISAFGNDIYKIVSMRPPPVSQSTKY